MTKMNAVILCGGRSSRMGKNKALLPFKLRIDDINDLNNEKRLVDFQYDKLSKIFKKVYISSKFEDDFKEYFTITDNKLIHSPMIALQSIFESLKDDEVFIITVDTPLITENTILKLVDFYSNNNFEIVIPQNNNKKSHNLCGVFNRTIKNKIDLLINDNIHKINSLIKQSKHSILTFDNEDEFLNINTKEDYKKALNVLNN